MCYFGLNCGKYLSFVLFYLFIELASCNPSFSRMSCDMTTPECFRTTLQNALPSFSKGMPDFGVELLDPFHIKELELMLSGGLKIKFLNGYAKGLRKCIVEKARIEHDVIETQFLCNLTIKGKYKSTGRLLMFPINGDGDAAIKCTNLRLYQTLKLKSINRSGNTYLEIANLKTNHTYAGRIQYNLTNLFKGSPETSKFVLDFMNQNWHMVAQEFGDPIVDFGEKIILRNVKNLLSTIPVKQLFPSGEMNPPA